MPDLYRININKERKRGRKKAKNEEEANFNNAAAFTAVA